MRTLSNRLHSFFSRLPGFALLIGVLAFGTQAAQAQNAADEPEAAKEFVVELSDRAIESWKDPTMNADEREERFRELMYNGFAVDFISKLVLGRHRRTADEDDLEAYYDEFPEYIVNSFTGRLNDYGNQTIEVTGTAPAGSRDVFVRSKIINPQSDAGPIKADWRVRKIDGEFKIVDVKVEGVSMAITKREEFSEIISNEGFSGLLEELRKGSVLETAQAE